LAQPTPTPTAQPGKLRLVLATHDRKVLDVECDEVVVPAVRGALGVLPGHTPLLATLQIGELFYRVGRREYYLALSWGFVEIGNDVVTVLAEFAEQPEEIDLQAAEREAAAMSEALRTATAETLAEVTDRLRLALVRAQVAKRPRAAA
jgi:F-type H+-transporting ATPase subunit epsilon